MLTISARDILSSSVRAGLEEVARDNAARCPVFYVALRHLLEAAALTDSNALAERLGARKFPAPVLRLDTDPLDAGMIRQVVIEVLLLHGTLTAAAAMCAADGEEPQRAEAEVAAAWLQNQVLPELAREAARRHVAEQAAQSN